MALHGQTPLWTERKIWDMAIEWFSARLVEYIPITAQYSVFTKTWVSITAITELYKMFLHSITMLKILWPCIY